MIVYPNAKINLGLHVLRRRSDGYHDLATIFYPIPLQDALEVHETERFRFRQAGNMLDCPAGDNLVIRVLRDLEAEFQIPELDIFLYKHIPDLFCSFPAADPECCLSLKFLLKIITANIY